MGIDVRAVCGCSLGTLISAQISDDYIQGQGLVKCQGSCEISGVITPAIGTAVTFTYTKNGLTRTIPRKLRVMSSFADPFRRTTRVELGCKLTYLSDLRESIDWSAFDGSGSAAYDPTDSQIITVPILAADAMAKCLTELGISASSNPLTNKFSIEEFDFSAGYVSVLSDLLVSESFCGYLDLDEVLQIIDLSADGGTGPVLDSTRIIDIGPIGAGALPGEAVTVSYSTLKLKKPEGEGGFSAGPIGRWEESSTTGPTEYFYVAYGAAGGTQGTQIYSGRTTTKTQTSYETVNDQDVVSTRITTVTGPSVAKIGTIASQYLSAGLPFGSTDVLFSRETTRYFYDSKGNPTREETSVSSWIGVVYGSLPVVFATAEAFIPIPTGNVETARTVTTYDNEGDRSQQITAEYKLWCFTQQGQQAISNAREVFDDPADTGLYIADTGGLVFAGVTVSTNRRVDPESRPSLASLTNAAYAKGAPAASFGSADSTNETTADPDNGYRTESSAELELALGSATAQRRIELSLPYAPDDVFLKIPPVGLPGATATYDTEASDAEAKANRYGRVQNRLLLGNRSGVSLQLEPERLPAAPFAPLVVQANGLSALYRVNAASWTLSAEGCIASTDALFWGAVGGTGAFWFPVAPGITALPTAPAVVDTTPSTVLGTVASTGANAQTTLNTAFPAATDGQGAFITATQEFWVYDGDTSLWVNVGSNPGPTATAGGVVPVWNETVKVEAGLRIGATVRSLAYPLAITTTVPPISTRIGASVRKVVLVEVPTAAVTVAALPPMISTGAAVRVPVAGVSLQALPPTVEATAPGVVNVPAAVVNLAALPPMISTGVVVQVPAAAVAISALAPAVQTITAVQVPAAAVTVAALAPTLDTRTPIFSKVSLLLPFDGTNGSQAFTDASSYAVAVTANGNAQISTAQSVFGGASGLFDGNNDYLTLSSSGLNLGTGDFTIEWRMRRAGNTATGSGSSQVLLDARTAEPSTQLNVYISNSTLGYVLTVYVNGSIVITGTAATLDTWIACALCRASGVTRLYMAGSQVGSSYTDSNSYTGTSWTIAGRFAAVSGDYRSFNGYLDDLRIVKGVALMSGTSYTVSSNPHPTA